MTAENTTPEATATALEENDFPKAASPEKEHQWLKQFVGNWDSEGECEMQPGQPITFTGTETYRAIGELWIVGDCENPAMEFHSSLTLGYDPDIKRFVGTWIDSMSTYFWRYEGSLDSTERILTLDTEGPLPTGTRARFKEVTEFKSEDHKVFTSSVLGDDGKWSTILTINSRRRK